MKVRRGIVALMAGLLLAACSASPSPSAAPSGGGLGSPSATPASIASVPDSLGPTPTPPAGVYAATVSGEIDPSIADVPERVYVPNELSGDVTVIDPATFTVIGRFATGAYPEHVTPDWDLQRLLVSNMNGGTLSVVDPRTAQTVDTITLSIFPYAVYFTVDGQKAIVVTDYISPSLIEDNGVHFYDRETWELLKFVQVPWPGADDLDLSVDGSYLMVSAEYSGVIARVDTREMALSGSVVVGSPPRAGWAVLLRRQRGTRRRPGRGSGGHGADRVHPDRRRRARPGVQP